MNTYTHTFTDLPIENEYPKLVRDKIPEIVQADGGVAKVRTLNDEEYLQFLLRKVVEESEELSGAQTDANLFEEIADLQELIDSILEFKQMTLEQMKSIQDEKREIRGGFKKRLLMLEKS